MTCREFVQEAELLTLSEVARSAEEQLVRHAQQCAGCETWLRQRRVLAGAMHSLSATTAGLEAGPGVEHALLQAFRRHDFSPPLKTTKFSPVALRVSRWFEVGAYAAAAAALLIAMFLGYRLVHRPPETGLANGNSKSVTLPARTDRGDSRKTAERTVATATTPALRERRKSAKPGAAGASAALTEEALARAGYTDLMLCDPLSCSSDAQVVRMELPVQGPADSHGVQTVMADVVVGDDGLVRAIRFVN